MENQKLIDTLKDQLNRTLGFFPRVESKFSVILSVDVGMLALLALNAPPLRQFDWYMLFAVIPVGLIIVSIIQVYFGMFPRLEGGSQSLLYFREIASKTESNFIEAFKAQSEEAYIKDLSGQIWRNFEILKKKFDHLKTAFTLLAWAMVPWLMMLAVFAAKNTGLSNLLVK